MRWALPLILLLGGCSDSSNVLEELPNSSIAGAPRDDVPETRLEADLTRPVTIGEDGPRLDACGAMGQVSRAGARGLALRAAPFADAREAGRLADGQRVHVCTRSLDQKWLGVVVPRESEDAPINATAAEDNCGVTEPVDRKQNYDGPCPSGWVSSASIRLVAG